MKTLVNLQSAPNDPKVNKNIGRDIKSTPHMHSLDHESQIFILFSLLAAVLKILHIFGFFQLTPILKFQRATKCLKAGLLRRKLIAYIPPCLAMFIVSVCSKFMHLIKICLGFLVFHSTLKRDKLQYLFIKRRQSVKGELSTCECSSVSFRGT